VLCNVPTLEMLNTMLEHSLNDANTRINKVDRK
jgi:hypothetical protein